MTTTNAFRKALNTIADFITEPTTKVDHETGEEVVVNTLGYAQKRLLNGICYSAALTLKSSEEQLEQAVAKVRLAARSHRGDEISEQQLQRAIDWADRIQLQVTTMDSVLEQAEAVYKEHTGETFNRPSYKPAVRKDFQSSALESAKRYGVDTESDRAGGVEVAEEEGV